MSITKFKKLFTVLSLTAAASGFSAELPEVMLLGDSIRMNYFPEVVAALKGQAKVWAPKENCQDTVFYRENLDKWCKGRQPKVIHFNVGLHDIFLNKAGECRRTPEQYRQNLQEIAKILRSRFPQAKIIFATSTPVDEARITASKTYGRLVRRNADIDRYNAIAIETLTPDGITIDDLNTLAKKNNPSALLRTDDGTHLNQDGKKLLGQAVAVQIREALK